MANPVFKSRCLANVGTTAQSVYTAPASKTSTVIQLDACNVKTGPAGTVHVTVYMKKGGNDYNLAKNAEVPAGGTLQVIHGQRMVLETGDAIWAQSDVNNSIDIIMSISEDV